jgi:hypothetical protein
MDLQFANTTTYLLWEGKGRGTISNESAVCKYTHLQSVRRQRQKQHEQMDLQFASTITYMLWEDRNSIHNRSAVCKHNHLQAVEREIQKQHKQMDLQFKSTITYKLWEGKCRNGISKWICSLQAQSLTVCGKVKTESV